MGEEEDRRERGNQRRRSWAKDLKGQRHSSAANKQVSGKSKNGSFWACMFQKEGMSRRALSCPFSPELL